MAKDYNPHMHTAEHVLNQTMVRMFGCGRCFSSHINPGKSKCDYQFDRDITDAEAKELEQRVNAALSAHVPVREEKMPRAQASALVDLSRLPKGAAEEDDSPVRLIFVGDYDICPCIGAHVENTREVGAFRLVSHGFTPAEEAGKQGTLRLRFSISPV